MSTASTSVAPGLAGPLPEKPKPAVEVASEAKPRRKHRYQLGGMIPWALVHVAVFGAFWSGVTWEAVAVCAGLFFFRIWAVTGIYHRYFSHRTYETSRAFQFVLAWFATMTSQRGVLWWAAHHRSHHLYSDTERDLHSPKQDGFWHSHAGWIFADNSETQWKRIKDFAKYPELVWLNKYWFVPPIVTGLVVFLLFGWSGLFIGFFLSQVLSWHATYVINSLCHVWGKRRFETKDTSRNNFWLALLTLGEGWHNNHHHYMNSARQGFYWWEIDITYYSLKLLSWVGLIWNIKEPPARVLEEGRRRDAAEHAA
ncbi:MAG TPA: acyl-CoA desaturase [Sandaracinaceae bacterium LLY-WYZ-13_1]|nr:acyl-CoA desaturase [Sandaracinaceae bacterium LLY-WYZ-13_1]